nr:vitamin B12-binding protein [Ligilactobacillus ruminis]
MALFFYQFTPLYGHNRAGSSIYGQIPEIAILPVTEGCVLRANPRNRRFARNRGLCFTGKSQKSTFCP